MPPGANREGRCIPVSRPGRSLSLIALLAFLSLGLPDGVLEGRDVAGGVAAAWLAVYWGSLTAGRVILGALTSRFAAETLLKESLAGVPLGVLVLWAGLGPAAGAVGLALLGLALAPVFPLLIAATPERVGTAYATHAVGFQIAAFYLGTAALPGAAGILARHLGLDVLGPFLLGTGLGLGVLYGLASGGRRARLGERVEAPVES
jgi:fucose permease